MNLNRVTLCGHTGKDARTAATQNGRNMTRLSVATTKRYKDSNGAWQEKTEWHRCICYGETAPSAAEIQTGAHVFIEGQLVYREYERTIETDSGPVRVRWPLTEIVVETLSVLGSKQRTERRGAA